MPRVPSYGDRKVAPQPLPTARRQSPTDTYESLGGQIGEAQTHLGGSVARIGLAGAQQIFHDEQQRADQVALLSADRQLGDLEEQLLRSPDKGALTVKGKDTLPLRQTVLSSFDEQASMIASNLTTDHQRIAFERMRLHRRADVTATVDQHTNQEMQAYDGQELKAYLETSTSAAIAQSTDPQLGPTRVATELARGEAALRDYAKRNGIGPDAVTAQVDHYRSNLLVGVIDRLRAQPGQDGAARTYFEETKHLIKGDQLARLEAALKNDGIESTAERTAAEIWHQLGPKGENDPIELDKMEAAARARFGADRPDEWRADGTPKGDGFLGRLRRPDGKVSSEISVGVNLDGKEVEIPALVPTLTADEVSTLLKLDVGKEPVPQPIVDKAVAFARERLAQGQSPFAGPGEQRTDVYPGLARAAGSDARATDVKTLKATVDALRSRKVGIDASRADRKAQTLDTIWSAVAAGQPWAQVKQLPAYVSAEGPIQNNVKDYYRREADRIEAQRYSVELRQNAREQRQFSEEQRRERQLELDGWAAYFDHSRPEVLHTLQRGEILAMLPMLGHNHVNRLLTEAEQLRTEDAKLERATIDRDQFVDVATQAGLPYAAQPKTKAEKANVARLEDLAKTEIARRQGSAGTRRELTREEKRDVIQGIVDTKVMLRDKGWFYSDVESIAGLVNPDDEKKAYVPIGKIPDAALTEAVNFLRGELPRDVARLPLIELKSRYAARLERAYALRLLGKSRAEIEAALKGQ